MSIALVFPGQSSQYVGMGKELCINYKIADDTFNEASEIVGSDLRKVCFEGTLEDISKTLITQQSVFTMGVAAYRVYMQEIGVVPDIFAGHSLGEITALTCANVIDFKDAVRIVMSRAAYMQEAVENSEGAMAAIGNIEHRIIDEECRKISNKEYTVGISNYNSPNQAVISGHRNLVTALVDKFKSQGAYTKYLNVNGAFHSHLMYSAAYKMQEELKKYQFNCFFHKVISNITGKPYTDKDELVEKLTFQIIKPVQWSKTIKYFEENGIDKVVELGPGQTLKKMMPANSNKIRSFAYDSNEDVEQLKLLIFNEEKPYVKNIIAMCLADSVSSKNYTQGSNEEYGKAVLAYNEIFELYKSIKKDMRLPERDEMKKALDMLIYVLQVKGTSIEEQRRRVESIINKSGYKHLFADLLI